MVHVIYYFFWSWPINLSGGGTRWRFIRRYCGCERIEKEGAGVGLWLQEIDTNPMLTQHEFNRNIKYHTLKSEKFLIFKKLAWKSSLMKLMNTSHMHASKWLKLCVSLALQNCYIIIIITALEETFVCLFLIKVSQIVGSGRPGHPKTEQALERSKTYAINTEIHSCLSLDLRAQSTESRSWVWNCKPRSITPPV